MKNKNYYVPLMLIFCLFFLWAISSNLLPTMIRQLMKTCELNAFEASFTETAYWLAYFICPIPIAMFMKKYSYKSGIIFGLLLAACGGLLFFPAAMLKEYWAYLCIFFIIATGMCFLETAANPYVTALGDPKSAPRRLNLAQSFNGLGAFIAAMFLSKLILSGNHYTRDTLPTSFPGGWEGYIQTETDAMKLPYLLLAMLLIVIAIIFIFSKLPKIKEGNTMEGVEYKGEKLPLVPRPRILTLNPCPRKPPFDVIFIPGAWLCRPPRTSVVFSFAISVPFTCTVAPVTNFFF
jgi:FHS family L-fucose permease-like MFS transporter